MNAAGSGVVTRLIDDKELAGLLASIGAGLVRQGFIPQGNVPGLYVYEKRKRPSVIIAILLLLIGIIPDKLPAPRVAFEGHCRYGSSQWD